MCQMQESNLLLEVDKTSMVFSNKVSPLIKYQPDRIQPCSTVELIWQLVKHLSTIYIRGYKNCFMEVL